MKRTLLICFILSCFALCGFSQEVSPQKLYKKAEKLFQKKEWERAKKIYVHLLENCSDSPSISNLLISVRERIMRCVFYKDEFDLEEVFKEVTGVVQFKLKKGNIPFLEMKFTFDSDKEKNLFSGGEVRDGSYVMTSGRFGCRVKFREPFLMDIQAETIPQRGLGIILFGRDNYKGESEGYFIQMGRGRFYPGLIRRGKKILAERLSRGIRINTSERIILQKTNGRIRLRAGKLDIWATDSKYSTGHVYMYGLDNGRDFEISEITIQSYVDPDWFRSFCGELEGMRWIEFKQKYEEKYSSLIKKETEEEKGKKKQDMTLTSLLTSSLDIKAEEIPEEDKKTAAECLLLINKKKYNQAEKKLTGIIAKNPDSFLGYFLRGVSRMQNSNSDAALEDLEKAWVCNTAVPAIPFAKGVIFFWKDEYDKAISKFEDSVSIDNRFTPGYFFECFVRYMNDDIKTAEIKMRGYAKKFSDDPVMQSGHRMLYILKNGPQWVQIYKATGSHYEVYSEINKANAKLVKKYAEAVYREYVRFFPYVKKSKEKYKIFVFNSFGSFADYAIDSGEVPPHPGIGGLYNSLLDHLLVRGDKPRNEMLSTVFHEGLHQYLEYHIKDAPIWFNEGLGTFFEASYFDQYGFHAGVLNKDRLEVLETAFNRKIPHAKILPLKEIMLADQSSFMEGLGNQVSVNYAQSWSLIYFMIMKRGMMEKYLRPYFKLLCKGKSKEEVYDEVFGKKMSFFEGMWKNYYLYKKYKKQSK